MTSSPAATDAVAPAKSHYVVLDGLRGVASLVVVVFHLFEAHAGGSSQAQIVNHGYLAVDFFFLLSGFVVAYAYDDRWKTMTTLQFFAIRLVRLHPLVLLGAVLGQLSFLFDPFGLNQRAIPLGTVLLDFALACLVLPHAPLPNRWTDSHSLNSPAWSLMQEYIGNILYALVLRRLNTWLLGLVVVIAAGFLVNMVWHSNTMDQGSAWDSIWGAPTRMAFSFTLGLWLYRVRDVFPKVRLGWIVLTVALVAAFAVPLVPKSIPHGNGLYEAFAAIVVFPLIILLGAHSDIGKMEMVLCTFAGRISYPLYILHFPFLFIYMNFVTFRKPSLTTAYLAGTAAFAIVVAFAWLALKVYDEPVRRMLRPLTGRKA